MAGTPLSLDLLGREYGTSRRQITFFLIHGHAASCASTSYITYGETAGVSSTSYTLYQSPHIPVRILVRLLYNNRIGTNWRTH